MAESYISNPVFIFFALGVVILIVFYTVFGKKFTKSDDFKPQQTKDTVYNEFKEKIDNQGLQIKKGKILVGVNKIADLDKWLRVKGNFSTYYFDQNTKSFMIDEKQEETPYDLLLFRAKHKFFLYRWLGLKKYFLFLKHDSLLRFDDVSNSFVLRDGTDLIPYADVWVNSADGMEYIHDVSIKRMNIELMSALENYPNKVVHLEMMQAKKERLYREMMETDKARYDAIKKAEDTVIS